jgi:hypothetical protein
MPAELLRVTSVGKYARLSFSFINGGMVSCFPFLMQATLDSRFSMWI